MYNRSFAHIILAIILVIWVVPFVALITTSFRSEIASKTSGFWTAFTPTELGHRFSTHDKGEQIKITEMRGNIFQRINKDEEWFQISGEIKSIMFKGRVPDPEKPGKTKLIRKLVPAGEVMDVRGGEFVFKANGDFIWAFPEEIAPKPKNLDVFINQEYRRLILPFLNLLARFHSQYYKFYHSYHFPKPIIKHLRDHQRKANL